MQEKSTTEETDCTKYSGRQRAICDGTSGLPEWKRQAYFQLWAEKSSTVPESLSANNSANNLFARAPCTHLGLATETHLCDLCSLKGQPFQVYACAIHGECSLTRKHSQVKSCAACADFAVAQSAPAS